MILSELMSLNDRKLKTLIKSARNINNVPSFCTFYPCIFHTAKKKLQQRKIHSNCCSSRNMISYSFRFFLLWYKVAWQAFFNLQTASKTSYVIKATDFPLLLDISLKFYDRFFTFNTHRLAITRLEQDPFSVVYVFKSIPLFVPLG